MSIRLTAELVEGRISTHDNLRVLVQVENAGEEPLTIPDLYDLSGALWFDLFNGREDPVRRISGLTRQAMTSSSRLDFSPSLETLGPGERWSREFDLSEYHYPMPAGRYRFEAVFRYRDAGFWMHSPSSDLVVEPAGLEGLSVVRDNPVLGRLRLILKSGGRFYLRALADARPLAASYGGKIAEGEFTTDPFCAAAAFFQASSFEPFYETHLVWSGRDSVFTRRYTPAQPDAPPRQAGLPAGARLLPFAHVTADGELLVWIETGQQLRLCRFGSELQPAFSIPRRAGGVHIGAGEDEFHVAWTAPGGLYERFDRSGRLVSSRLLLRTPASPVRCQVDLESGSRVKAVFTDAPRGKSYRLVAAADGAEPQVRARSFPFRSAVREIDFDCDPQGRFHLLVTTEEKRLYYFRDDDGPRLIAEGEDRFFPRAFAPRRAYLGCFRRDFGYHYLECLAGTERIASYERGPWES